MIKKLLFITVLISLVGAYGCAGTEDDGGFTGESSVNTLAFAEARRDSKDDVDATSAASEKVDGEYVSVVREYFEAVAHDDLDKFLDVFSEGAVVNVVNRRLDQQEAISKFASNEVLGGEYVIYRAEESDAGIKMLLQFTPKGWTSSEAMAVYDFKIDGGKIVLANLQYATDQDKVYFRDKTLEDTVLMPQAYTAYLQGVSNDDMALFMSAFTEDAKILDVSRLIEGKASIESWADREVLFLLYKVGRITYTEKGVEVINHIRFNENAEGFYGSYDMTLVNGLIEFADLQYSNIETYSY